jgi:polar amino acid transport system substrate-binding protein
MKKLLFVFLLTTVSVICTFAQSIPLGTGEWAPFAGQNLKNLGFVNDVAAKAFALEGITVSFDFKPWARIESETFNGIYAASPGWASTAERKERFFYSKDPIMTDGSILISLAGSSFTWNSMNDLKKYTIGSNRADYYVSDLRKAGVRVVELDTYTQGITMLLAKRFDALIINGAVGRQLLRSLPASDKSKLIVSAKDYDSTGYYILFSRKYPNVQSLISKFEAGFEKLRKSGEYDKMVKDLQNGVYD